jgi:hypothetical protein
MIANHMDGNLILQQAFQTKADKHCIPAFNTIMARLAAHGLLVDLNIRDNEASADFKRVITESWKTKFQLVPPDMHQRNKAERMIQHFKNHFLQKPLPLHSCQCQRHVSTIPLGSPLTPGQING